MGLGEPLRAQTSLWWKHSLRMASPLASWRREVASSSLMQAWKFPLQVGTGGHGTKAGTKPDVWLSEKVPPCDDPASASDASLFQVSSMKFNLQLFFTEL